MKSKRSQTGVEVVIWIAVVIAGIFLAKEVGLFTIFTPNTPNSNLNTIVNKIYYGEATDQSNWPCATTGDSTKCISCYYLGTGGTKVFWSGKANADGTCPSGWPLCDSYQPVIPIKDQGKYACSNGNVVTRYCGSFGENIVDTCSLGCSYFSNYQLDTNTIANVVKCNGDYKPNQKVCSSDLKILYSTDSSGNLESPLTCGYQCLNGQCSACQVGAGRCSGNMPQICDGTGNWQNQTPCINLQQCKQSGTSPSTSAVCSSDYSEGDQRCSGNQPQIYHTSGANFVDNGPACLTTCQLTNNIASCTNQCTANSCEIGTLFSCNISDNGNIKQQLASCTSGLCLDGTNCKSPYDLGNSYCIGSSIQKAIQDTTSSAEANGGVRLDVNNKINCIIGCSDSSGSPKCLQDSRCIGKENKDICTDSVHKGTCSASGENVSNIIDCTASLGTNQAQCDSSSGVAICKKPADQCSGNFACNLGSIYSCNNNQWANILDNCNQKGCTGTIQTNSQCNDECSGSNVCVGTRSYKCNQVNVSDVDGKQNIKGDYTECGTKGCNNQTGLCNSQCTGNQSCSSGALRECNNGQLGDIIDNCNNIGCDGSTCKDQCTDLDTYSCSNGNSQICILNLTNNQKLIQTIQCGIDGCDSSTGKCKTTGIPNAHVCLGQDLHPTDSNGLILSSITKSCSVEQDRNGLKPFCKSSEKTSTGINDYNDCLVCNIQGQIICTNTQLYQCGDIYLGTPTNIQNCEVGCLNDNGNYYCDNLNMVISGNQNFLLTDDLNIVGTLKRSQSNKGLSITNIKGTLSIANSSNQVVMSSSGDTGSFGINFGKASKFGLGNYEVKVELPDYNKVINVNVKITNDFIIGISGDPILVLIPGTTPFIPLTIKGGTGVPDSIVGSNPPQGITSYEVRKNEALGQWQLFATGNPGKYDINLSAVQNGVRLEAQKISIEIRNPQLTISSGIPTSLKPGKTNYDIKVTGPTGASTTQGIVPDNITVTINGNQIDLSNSNLGSGTYSPQFDFSNTGTYTLNVIASKSGYEDASYSKSIQVSTSGTETVPGTGTNQTVSPTCGNNICDAGETNSNCPNDCKSTNINWTLIIIAGIIGFILWRMNK